MSKIKYYVCEIKKAFDQGTKYCVNFYIENIIT